MLRCKSVAVKPGVSFRSRSVSGCRRAPSRGLVFLGRVFFLVAIGLAPKNAGSKKRSEREGLSPDSPFPHSSRTEPMATSNAVAIWEGKLKDGKGSFKAQSGAFSGSFSFGTPFAGKKRANPQELVPGAPARRV